MFWICDSVDEARRFRVLRRRPRGRENNDDDDPSSHGDLAGERIMRGAQHLAGDLAQRATIGRQLGPERERGSLASRYSDESRAAI